MATSNPPVDVQKLGQSIWYDNLSRDMIRSGELKRLIDEYGVVGMTSNPTIFEKAIGEGNAYDATIQTLLDLDADQIFDQLAIEDIRAAADLLRPIFDRTKGVDGYISLEVSPTLANDTATTLSEAKRLFKTVDRPNVMIKIPGTPAGLPAIEEALYAGVNINITLLFSVQNYIEVAQAYLRALERRLADGLPIDKIASVASFFLSRIDTMIDKQLEGNIQVAKGRDVQSVSDNGSLLGKAAIANAKVAYKHFKDIFQGERWQRLAAAGAHVQRPLWASTGTKNPAYADTLYVDELIGPHTVNTVPQATLFAFKDHGKVAATLEQDVAQAEAVLQKLASVGVNLDRVTSQLQEDGVKAFVDSFKKLIAQVDGKRKTLLGGFTQRQEAVLGLYHQDVINEIQHLHEQRAVASIWNHDAKLWKNTPEHVKSITSRLGWLTVANDGRIDRARLRDLREVSRQLGWKHVVLLGMGGSSLAPEVLWKTFGQQDGYPALIVLDSTDPEAIRNAENQIDLDKTVFIVASKSGTTIETLSMQRYFYNKYQDRAGEHFIAITDPGSKLEGWAKELGFRQTFLNPNDIGGRYSALSYFGMVPAALMGLNFEKLLDRGAEIQQACDSNVTSTNHPGLWLGAIMGTLAHKGYDKLTLITSPVIASFGDWVEQLVAESTGKEGKGIVPVTGEIVGTPRDYSDDRQFVYLRVEDAKDNPDKPVQALKAAGYPLVTLHLRDAFDLGAEFFRWEFATATAGAILAINPFDEPNVTESKNNTMRLLGVYQESGQLPTSEPILKDGKLALYADGKLASLLQNMATEQGGDAYSLVDLLAAYFNMARSGNYMAVMAYLPPSAKTAEQLETIRHHLRNTYQRAVTVGFGPRFLHSTGQLHKGGPNNGLFIQITVEDKHNPAIPEASYGFSILKQAQAMGDLQSLQDKERRVIRLHINDDAQRGLAKIIDAVEDAVDKRK